MNIYFFSYSPQRYHKHWRRHDGQQTAREREPLEIDDGFRKVAFVRRRHFIYLGSVHPMADSDAGSSSSSGGNQQNHAPVTSAKNID